MRRTNRVEPAGDVTPPAPTATTADGTRATVTTTTRMEFVRRVQVVPMGDAVAQLHSDLNRSLGGDVIISPRIWTGMNRAPTPFAARNSRRTLWLVGCLFLTVGLLVLIGIVAGLVLTFGKTNGLSEFTLERYDLGDLRYGVTNVNQRQFPSQTYLSAPNKAAVERYLSAQLINETGYRGLLIDGVLVEGQSTSNGRSRRQTSSCSTVFIIRNIRVFFDYCSNCTGARNLALHRSLANTTAFQNLLILQTNTQTISTQICSTPILSDLIIPVRLSLMQAQEVNSTLTWTDRLVPTVERKPTQSTLSYTSRSATRSSPVYTSRSGSKQKITTARTTTTTTTTAIPPDTSSMMMTTIEDSISTIVSTLPPEMTTEFTSTVEVTALESSTMDLLLTSTTESIEQETTETSTYVPEFTSSISSDIVSTLASEPMTSTFAIDSTSEEGSTTMMIDDDTSSLSIDISTSTFEDQSVRNSSDTSTVSDWVTTEVSSTGESDTDTSSSVSLYSSTTDILDAESSTIFAFTSETSVEPIQLATTMKPFTTRIQLTTKSSRRQVTGKIIPVIPFLPGQSTVSSRNASSRWTTMRPFTTQSQSSMKYPRGKTTGRRIQFTSIAPVPSTLTPRNASLRWTTIFPLTTQKLSSAKYPRRPITSMVPRQSTVLPRNTSPQWTTNIPLPTKKPSSAKYPGRQTTGKMIPMTSVLPFTTMKRTSNKPLTTQSQSSSKNPRRQNTGKMNLITSIAPIQSTALPPKASLRWTPAALFTTQSPLTTKSSRRQTNAKIVPIIPLLPVQSTAITRNTTSTTTALTTNKPGRTRKQTAYTTMTIPITTRRYYVTSMGVTSSKTAYKPKTSMDRRRYTTATPQMTTGRMSSRLDTTGTQRRGRFRTSIGTFKQTTPMVTSTRLQTTLVTENPTTAFLPTDTSQTAMSSDLSTESGSTIATDVDIETSSSASATEQLDSISTSIIKTADSTEPLLLIDLTTNSFDDTSSPRIEVAPTTIVSNISMTMPASSLGYTDEEPSVLLTPTASISDTFVDSSSTINMTDSFISSSAHEPDLSTSSFNLLLASVVPSSSWIIGSTVLPTKLHHLTLFKSSAFHDDTLSVVANDSSSTSISSSPPAETMTSISPIISTRSSIEMNSQSSLSNESILQNYFLTLSTSHAANEELDTQTLPTATSPLTLSSINTYSTVNQPMSKSAEYSSLITSILFSTLSTTHDFSQTSYDLSSSMSHSAVEETVPTATRTDSNPGITEDSTTIMIADSTNEQLSSTFIPMSDGDSSVEYVPSPIQPIELNTESQSLDIESISTQVSNPMLELATGRDRLTISDSIDTTLLWSTRASTIEHVTTTDIPEKYPTATQILATLPKSTDDEKRDHLSSIHNTITPVIDLDRVTENFFSMSTLNNDQSTTSISSRTDRSSSSMISSLAEVTTSEHSDSAMSFSSDVRKTSEPAILTARVTPSSTVLNDILNSTILSQTFISEQRTNDQFSTLSRRPDDTDMTSSTSLPSFTHNNASVKKWTTDVAKDGQMTSPLQTSTTSIPDQNVVTSSSSSITTDQSSSDVNHPSAIDENFDSTTFQSDEATPTSINTIIENTLITPSVSDENSSTITTTLSTLSMETSKNIPSDLSTTLPINVETESLLSTTVGTQTEFITSIRSTRLAAISTSDDVSTVDAITSASSANLKLITSSSKVSQDKLSSTLTSEMTTSQSITILNDQNKVSTITTDSLNAENQTSNNELRSTDSTITDTISTIAAVIDRSLDSNMPNVDLSRSPSLASRSATASIRMEGAATNILAESSAIPSVTLETISLTHGKSISARVEDQMSSTIEQENTEKGSTNSSTIADQTIVATSAREPHMAGSTTNPNELPSNHLTNQLLIQHPTIASDLPLLSDSTQYAHELLEETSSLPNIVSFTDDHRSTTINSEDSSVAPSSTSHSSLEVQQDSSTRSSIELTMTRADHYGVASEIDSTRDLINTVLITPGHDNDDVDRIQSSVTTSSVSDKFLPTINSSNQTSMKLSTQSSMAHFFTDMFNVTLRSP